MLERYLDDDDYAQLQAALNARPETGAIVPLTQAQFASLLGVSVRTLQDWEQGRREPSGAAKTLIKVAELHPQVLRKIAARRRRFRSCWKAEQALRADAGEQGALARRW